MWLLTLCLSVPRRSRAVTAGGLCTAGQPSASAKCIQRWCFRQCMCKGREGADGGGLFLPFHSWALVLFCLLTMWMCRSSVPFPVVLTAKGKKASGVSEVLTSCLLFLHGPAASVQVSFTAFKDSSYSLALVSEQAVYKTGSSDTTSMEADRRCLQHESSSAVSGFLLKLCFSALFHLTVPRAFRKRAHRSFRGNT